MSRTKKFKIKHFLILFFIIYVIYTIGIQQLKMVELSRQEAELAEKINNAIEEREQLKKEIQLLQTDEYIERIARDELGLVKPGELVYKFTEKASD